MAAPADRLRHFGENGGGVFDFWAVFVYTKMWPLRCRGRDETE